VGVDGGSGLSGGGSGEKEEGERGGAAARGGGHRADTPRSASTLSNADPGARARLAISDGPALRAPGAPRLDWLARQVRTISGARRNFAPPPPARYGSAPKSRKESSLREYEAELSTALRAVRGAARIWVGGVVGTKRTKLRRAQILKRRPTAGGQVLAPRCCGRCRDERRSRSTCSREALRLVGRTPCARSRHPAEGCDWPPGRPAHHAPPLRGRAAPASAPPTRSPWLAAVLLGECFPQRPPIPAPARRVTSSRVRCSRPQDEAIFPTMRAGRQHRGFPAPANAALRRGTLDMQRAPCRRALRRAQAPHRPTARARSPDRGAPGAPSTGNPRAHPRTRPVPLGSGSDAHSELAPTSICRHRRAAT